MEHPFPEPGMGGGVHSHHDIFLHGHAAKELGLLKGPVNPQGSDLVRL